MQFQSKNAAVRIIYQSQDKHNFIWGLFVEGKYKKSQGVSKASKKVPETFGYSGKDFNLVVV